MNVLSKHAATRSSVTLSGTPRRIWLRNPEPDPSRGTAQDDERHEKLTVEARKWVAQTFFGVILKQMRESPFKSELFSGGRGGQAFGSMLDQHMADRMSRAAGEQLVKSIVRKFEASAKREATSSESRTNDAHEQESDSKPKIPATGYDFSKVKVHVAPALRG